MENEEDIDNDSSIIWMSFGASRDLFLRHNYSVSLNTHNLVKPKFSTYKLNFSSGSLIQIKPQINSFWSHQLPASAETGKGLHIMLRFLTHIEEKSYDGEVSQFFSDTSTSKSKSGGASYCSTISPETEKVKRMLYESE